MISKTFTVGTTRSQILDGAPAARTIYVHVIGNTAVYLGGSTVTTANGLLTEKHTSPVEFFIPPHEELWAVVAAATEDLRIMQPVADGN